MKPLQQAKGVAILGGLMAAAAAWGDRGGFWQAYLVGWFFWFGIAIGSLGLLLLFHLTGGRWGKALQPILESAAQTLPWWGLLFLPVLFEMSRFYPWAQAGHAADPLLAHKAVYLNVPFFTVRAVVYFTFWSWLAYKVPRWTGAKLARASSLGLLAFVVTLTFSAFDWLMSLDPHWGSSLYGALILVGAVLSALAFGVVVLPQSGNTESQNDTQALHDLGNLLLAFTLLWAYMQLSQYLIIWYGNLPEEIGWYKLRGRGSWAGVAAFLVMAQFVMPFLLLLNRGNKRTFSTLSKIALWILAVRFIDLFWLVMPEFRRDGFSISLMDLVVPAALGGAWMTTFYRRHFSRNGVPNAL